MTVQSVQANINKQNYNLSYNAVSGKWEAPIPVPSASSYNKSGHYYPVILTITGDSGSFIKDDTDSEFGNSLRLFVQETVKPTISILYPVNGASLETATVEVDFQLRDDDSGIDIDTLAVTFDSVQVNDVVSVPAVGGHDCTLTLLNVMTGAHTLNIDVSDFDGNIADTKTISFTITSLNWNIWNLKAHTIGNKFIANEINSAFS
jgi:hypothetical protein